MTIFEAYNNTKKKLQAAGIEDYVFEAKEIIKRVTGLTAPQILVNYNNKLSEFQQNNLIALTKQREIRYPLQYIFGSWDFYGRPFSVGPGVLIPRADTETVVEVALEYLKEIESPKILDLCAGSGCIGITLACEVKNSFVTMVEKYTEAASYLNKNITANNAENTTVLLGDVFEGDGNAEKYNLVVSNPPYIPESEKELMSPETKFEPETALMAGDAGMEFYKAITANYKNCIVEGGMLLFEVGIGESQRVAEILTQNGFCDIKITKDLNETERAVSGIKR